MNSPHFVLARMRAGQLTWIPLTALPPMPIVPAQTVMLVIYSPGARVRLRPQGGEIGACTIEGMYRGQGRGALVTERALEVGGRAQGGSGRQQPGRFRVSGDWPLTLDS